MEGDGGEWRTKRDRMRDSKAESWEDGVRALETEMAETDSRPPQTDVYSTPQIQQCEY